jgi:hypothetical protein
MRTVARPVVHHAAPPTKPTPYVAREAAPVEPGNHRALSQVLSKAPTSQEQPRGAVVLSPRGAAPTRAPATPAPRVNDPARAPVVEGSTISLVRRR